MKALETILVVLGTSKLCSAISHARILNRCAFPVYIRSVLADSPTVISIDPGASFVEQYRSLVNFNPAYGYDTTVGVSMKIVRDAKVGQAVNDQQRIAAFETAGALTQFEYTYDPSLSPDVYYDVSDVDDASPRQFCQWGLKVVPDSPECETISCPASCAQECAAVYNVWNDDHATHGCNSNIGMTLVLCSSAEKPSN
jgi:hypothetical protein